MLSAKKFLIPAVTAALALGSWAAPSVAADDSAGDEAAAEKSEKKRRSSCAFRRNISGFTVIDDEHFVLESGARDFLVTLSPGCRHLHFETAIAIKSTPAAGVCVERGDRVIVDRIYTCWIRDIEQVEDKKEAEKIVEERTKAEEEDGS
ncbi:MAG: DUF6491 family protein [Alphaproteobacteria bacterium]